ncbi:MAG: hypothetical protein ACO1OF_05275 [Adhaeribacter sp.]
MKFTLLSKLFIFFVIFYSLLLTSFAQTDFRPGYVITNTSDTLTGFINYKGFIANTKECTFKANLNDKSTTFSPSQISAYRFNSDKFYVSNSYLNFKSNSPIFLEYLLRGRVNLFQYRDDSGDHFVISKDTLILELDNTEKRVNVNGTQYISNPHLYKGQLRALMGDHLALFHEIDKTDFNIASLMKIVKKYNDQSQKAISIQFEEKKRPYKFNFGIHSSYGKPNLYLNDFTYQPNHYGISKANFNTNYSFTVGVLLDIHLLEMNDKLHFLVEPAYSKTSFGSDVTKKSGTYNSYHNTININLTALRLPFSLKYSFNSLAWKTQPFLRGGVAHYKFLKRSAAYSYLVEEQTSKASGKYSNFDFSKYQNALFFSVGTDILGKKHKLSTEIIFEGGDGIYRVKYKPFLTLSRTSNLIFQLAYVL